jgi:hypothetical protein
MDQSMTTWECRVQLSQLQYQKNNQIWCSNVLVYYQLPFDRICQQLDQKIMTDSMQYRLVSSIIA